MVNTVAMAWPLTTAARAGTLCSNDAPRRERRAVLHLCVLRRALLCALAGVHSSRLRRLAEVRPRREPAFHVPTGGSSDRLTRIVATRARPRAPRAPRTRYGGRSR